MKTIIFEKENLKKTIEEQVKKLMAVIEREKKEVDGLTVFRADTRSSQEIEKAGGFYPAKGNGGEDWVANAKKIIDTISEATESNALISFVQEWKTPDKFFQYKNKIIEKEGKLIGVCCGVNEGQKGGQNYIINVPDRLYLINMYEGKVGSKVVIYGDSANLEDCKLLAMNLKIASNIEEFVFLTPVPLQWIREYKIEN